MPAFEHSTARMDPFAALDAAVARTRSLLFRPFDPSIWFSFGIIIFCEVLFRNAGSILINPDMIRGPLFDDAHSPLEAMRDFGQTLADHSIAAIGIAIVSGLFVLLGVLTYTWFSSRGQLMFVRAVATGDARVEANWDAIRPLAGSLFLFRIVLHLLEAIFYAGLILLGGLAFWIFGNESGAGLVLAFAIAIPMIILAAIGALCLWVAKVLLRAFVVPIMYSFEMSCTEAWGVFLPVVRENIGPLFVFLVLRTLILLATSALATLAGLFTCCIAVLPVIHQTILAPVYVFERAFALYTLESAGERFRIIAEPSAA